MPSSPTKCIGCLFTEAGVKKKMVSRGEKKRPRKRSLRTLRTPNVAKKKKNH